MPSLCSQALMYLERGEDLVAMSDARSLVETLVTLWINDIHIASLNLILGLLMNSGGPVCKQNNTTMVIDWCCLGND